MKKIPNYQLKELKTHCQNKIRKILISLENISREEKNIKREEYRGYYYTIKVCNNIINKNKNLTKKDFYLIFKNQIIEINHNKPLSKIFYEIMNF
ncbi:MAG: hypothetical protein U9N59_05410, partial [Campylobacterota bacterium]|nr:hypothetical protein [Campylobacterota bacterium]